MPLRIEVPFLQQYSQTILFMPKGGSLARDFVIFPIPIRLGAVFDRHQDRSFPG
jgi:hypothetical protein